MNNKCSETYHLLNIRRLSSLCLAVSTHVFARYNFTRIVGILPSRLAVMVNFSILGSCNLEEFQTSSRNYMLMK